MSAHKRNLRKLAFAVGVVPRDANSLHMSAEEFEEKLVGLYPEIGQLGDDEVTALIADAEAGATASPPPTPEKSAPPAKAKAKAAPPPSEEEEEEEEAPVAAPPAPAARRGRPPKGVSTPAPAPVVAEEESEPEASRPAVARPAGRPVAAKPAQVAAVAVTPPVDLELRNMIKDIGTKVFDYESSIRNAASKDAVEKLSAEVKELRATLKAMAGYLTWQYNSQVDESDAVKSITEVAW